MTTTKWSMDPTHSEIQFKVKHLMISTVTGQFSRFNSSIETEGNDFTKAKIKFTADVDSITTNNEQRDSHLKNGDFFDAANYPQIVFESKRMEKINDEEYKLHGLLNMRGIARPVVLNVAYGGQTIDPWGNTRVGFSISGAINRRDFGINFSMVSETGGILLGEEVKLIAGAEFVLEANKQAA
jgi:polyisoprenoid-binding protein YceI